MGKIAETLSDEKDDLNQAAIFQDENADNHFNLGNDDSIDSSDLFNPIRKLQQKAPGSDDDDFTGGALRRMHGNLITPDYDLDAHLNELNRFRHDKVEMQTTTKTGSQLNLHVVQEIGNAHSDSIWVAKFSPCGKYLATGGKDACLKVWRVKGTKQTDDEEEGNETKKEEDKSDE